MGKAFVFELLPNQKPSLKSTNEFKSIGDFITHADAAGCYTTMRTFASSKILSFEQHVARLTKFSGLPFADEGEFAAVLIETLASLQQEDSWQPEQKICVTVGHNTLRKVIMGIFLENLTSLCNSKVIALFHPTRHEPSVKSTDWVRYVLKIFPTAFSLFKRAQRSDPRKHSTLRRSRHCGCLRKDLRRAFEQLCNYHTQLQRH